MAAGPIRISILADSKGAVRGINQTAAAADSLASKVRRSVGPALATGFAIAGVAAVKMGADAIKAASDAEQSLGATETVFGRVADAVVKNSKRASEAYGLSANEYRENANLIGSLFRNQGVASDRLAKKTDDMIAKAADLAATFGGPTSSAVEALSSAFKGEFDPLERYGISIKQSDINARLAAKGQDKLTDAAKKQAQQIATSELIMEQSARATGAFARESDTLAGKQQRLAAKVEDVKAKIGKALIPVMLDLADFASREVVPVLDKFSKYLNENSDEIRKAAKEWGGRFLSALEDVWSVAKPLLKALNAIPGPMKEIALQAGLIAVAMKKIGLFSLTNSFASLGTTLDTTARQTDKAATSLSRFGTIARNVAGVGGMVALTQAGSTTNETMSGLLTIMGGAGVGFMVAGPWGALAGAVGGAGKALWDADRAMKQTVTDAQNLNSTIHQGTAARLQKEADDYLSWALTLNNAGNVTLDTIRKIRNEINAKGPDANLATSLASEMEVLGLNSETVTKAMTGNRAALREVALAMSEASNGSVSFDQAMKALRTNSELSVDAYAQINTEVLSFALGWSKVRGEMTTAQQNIAAVHRATKGLRAEVREPIRTLFKTNAPDTTIEIARVAKQYKLTPDEIKTVIKLSGVDTSKGHIKSLMAQLDGIAPQAKKSGEKAGKEVNAGTGDGVRKNKNLWIDAYKQSITGGTAEGLGIAKSGGLATGSNVGLGMWVGMDRWVGPILEKGRQLGRNAVQGAKEGAEVNSPSRATTHVGRMMGEGLAVGLNKSKVRAKAAADDLMLAVLASVTQGSEGVDRALDLLTKKIEKTIKGKNDEKREKRILKSLKDQYAALRANGAAQDALQQKLDEAKQAYEDLAKTASDYAATVRAAVVATGNVASIGTGLGGRLSSANIIDQLRKKVVDAQKFTALIAELTKSGLNQTAIQQMVDAGVEGGLATAQALVDGGAEAVAEINSLQSQLDATGKTLGDSTSATFYNTGLQIAQGLVNGLNSQMAALQAVAAQMAQILTQTTKKKLKVKSPSRLFREIGSYVIDGLVLGLDPRRTEIAGERIAAGLEDGFGAPALAAFTTARSQSSNTPFQLIITSEGLDQLTRGRAIRADLDAWDSVGGRALAS